MLSFGLNGSYEGNVLFTEPTDGDEADYSHGLAGSLARTWKLRRGGASLAASATQSFYRDTASLNDFRYNVFGSISHAISRRLTWSGTATTSSGLARDSRVLTDSGLVLPSVTARSSSSSSTFNYRLSDKSQLGWSVSQSGVGFSSALFAGGTSLSSSVGWSRTVGRSQSLGVTQDYTRTFIEGADASIFGVLGTWSLTNGRWTTYASAGVRPYSVPDDGYHMSLGLSAGVTRPLRPGQVVGLTYSKSIEQGFGLSRANNLVQNVSGTYTTTLLRNLTASFAGTFTFAKDPLQPDRLIKGQVGQVSFGYTLMRNLNISGGTAVYSRVEVEERATSSTTYLGLNYVATWR